MPCLSPEARMKSLRIMYVQFNVSKVFINNLVRNSEASFFESSEIDAHGSFMVLNSYSWKIRESFFERKKNNNPP
jgi:hypothetical protein